MIFSYMVRLLGSIVVFIIVATFVFLCLIFAVVCGVRAIIRDNASKRAEKERIKAIAIEVGLTSDDVIRIEEWFSDFVRNKRYKIKENRNRKNGLNYAIIIMIAVSISEHFRVQQFHIMVRKDMTPSPVPFKDGRMAL